MDSFMYYVFCGDQINVQLPFGHHCYLIFTYIRLLPSVPRHCLVVGYADDHTLLTTIPHKDNHVTAAAQLNADLAALCEYGHHWNVKFTPQKTFL